MRHHIFIGSAYNLGQRIGLHFTEQKEVDKFLVKYKKL